MNRLQKKYQEELKLSLQKQLSLSNPNQVPELIKIVVNSGVGRAVVDSKNLDPVIATISKITGQKPVVTKAQHSIATFKLREGMPIGVSANLRGERMYAFLDRLVSIVLPRVRDFRGLGLQSFDPSGNYSIGINDQTVFSELSHEDSAAVHGLQVTLVTSGNNKEASLALLRALGLPFVREEA